MLEALWPAVCTGYYSAIPNTTRCLCKLNPWLLLHNENRKRSIMCHKGVSMTVGCRVMMDSMYTVLGWGQRSDQQVCYEQSSLNVLHYRNDSSSDCSSCANLHSSNDGSIRTHITLGAQYSIDFNTSHERTNNEDQQPDMCCYSVPYSSSVVQKHISELECGGLESLWLGLDRKKMTWDSIWTLKLGTLQLEWLVRPHFVFSV